MFVCVYKHNNVHVRTSIRKYEMCKVKLPHENSKHKLVLYCVFFSKLISGSFSDSATAYLQQYTLYNILLYIIKNYRFFNLKTCLTPIPSHHDDFNFLWF